MTYGAFTQDFAPYQAVARPRKPIPQTALCAVILALSTSAGLWALYARPLATQASIPAPQQVAPSVEAAPRAILPRAKKTVQRDAALLYPSLMSGYTATTFARSVPLRSMFEPRLTRLADAAALPAIAPRVVPLLPADASPLVADVPLPAPRPSALLAASAKVPPRSGDRQVAVTSQPATPAATPAIAAEPRVVPTLPADPSPLVADVPLPAPRPSALLAASAKVPPRSGDRQVAVTGQPAAPAAAPPTFLEKMFGTSRPLGTALAYAAPEDGGLVGNVLKEAIRRPGAYDRWTAVYDIEAHTVYLPDGTRLEAHSGLGPSRDNPASVALRMRGVTPPNLYDLTVRETLFHGVRALRLTPLGGTTYGRAGLLAHTYMLRGRSGESNGCVVFKDYQAFLRAYDSGAIRRLAVVARMN